MTELLAHTETWGLILGLLLPLLTSLVQQPTWTNQVRVLVAVAAAAIVGTLTVLANGQVNPEDWFATFGVVLVAAQTAYHGIWKPAGVAQVIELFSSKHIPQHRKGDEAAREAA